MHGQSAEAAKVSIWSGLYSIEQAEYGRQEYMEKCSNCHADNLVGMFPAPPLRGAGFVTRWNGKSVRDIYSRIRSTMPADEPGTLSRKETFAITAFLFQENGFPAGENELTGKPKELQQMMISLEK